MSRFGKVYENPVTGERAVVRTSPEQSAEDVLIADLYLRPGARVVGEHVHPNIEEKFTVVSGVVGFSLNGHCSMAASGQTVVVPPGIAHDWWNGVQDVSVVRVEIRPGARFQKMIMNFFGLAQDGKTDAKGMPSLLQLALIAREFSDVVYFTRPPRVIQKFPFGLLAPLARS
jgi:quercetin dioxygenase-like cupin family protein